MKQITPYLFFDGNCREAMNFYSEIFAGKLDIMTVADSPMADKMPDMKDRVMHAAITVDNILILMASDTMLPGQGSDMGEGVYNTIICSTKEELKTFFDKLIEGGKVVMPIEDAFFGTIGSLTDKFGVKWMLEYDLPKEN